MDPLEDLDDLDDLDDLESLTAARRDALAAGCRAAARRALGFAHRYREEEGTAGGSRERACILQALEWRKAARDIRAGRANDVVDAARPGLARARDAALRPGAKRAAG